MFEKTIDILKLLMPDGFIAFLLKPVFSYRKTREKFILLVQSNRFLICNPGIDNPNERKKIYRELKKLEAEFKIINNTFGIKFFQKIKSIPCSKDLNEVRRRLIQTSNLLRVTGERAVAAALRISENVTEIERLLNIKNK